MYGRNGRFDGIFFMDNITGGINEICYRFNRFN